MTVPVLERMPPPPRRWNVAPALVTALALTAVLETATPAGAEETAPPTPQVLPAYGLFEISFPVALEYTNPFDSSSVEVNADIHTPDGTVLTVPCFYDGDAGWKMRFTPSRPGDYSYRITAKTPAAQAETAAGRFRVEPGPEPGFVRVGQNTSRHFVFDNGDSYFPVGENMGWVHWGSSSSLSTWISYLEECQQAGVNWIRIWMCPWGMTELVWTPRNNRYHGYQQYDLDNARGNDGIFQEAQKRGIYIQWVINHHGQYSINTNPEWDNNPYNVKNGGFLESPEQFFTNEEAKRHYRDRLRYLVARWGYSTHLLAWEFWNEVDLTHRYDPAVVKAWHEEMSAYLRGLDPYDHLQTSSTSSNRPELYEARGLDFLQSHAYVQNIIGTQMTTSRQRYEAYPDHPHFFGEMSYDWRGPNTGDKEGVILHNQLWASVHSHDAGTAMTWWWDNWVRPYNLYYHFRAVANYVEGIHWDKENLLPMETRIEPVSANRTDLTFIPLLDWEKSGRRYFIIQPDGRVEGLEECTHFVHGAAHREMAPNPLFRFTLDQPSRFLIQIDRVAAAGAVCVVELDGAEVFRRAFASQENDSTMTGEEGSVAIPVPAGSHTLSVLNPGRDWFRVQSYTLENFVERAVAYARGNADRVLVWVHDRPHQYALIARYAAFGPTEPTMLVLPDLREGEFRVEPFDPYTGVAGSPSVTTATGTGLNIPLPSFRKDTAFRIRRVSNRVEWPLPSIR